MISLQPTTTEFVDIEHREWGAQWSIQFPEVLESAAGTIMAWPLIRPDWQSLDSTTWGYTWRPPADYVQQVQALNLTTPSGQPQYSRFVAGAELRAQIAVRDSAIELVLTVTNTGTQPLREVRSEGGCFQARSAAWRDGDEVARSYVRCGGKMTSLARLDRTEPERCLYVTEPKRDTQAFEWFWGKTSAVIDAPAIVGAVARDGQHAMVLGYDQASEVLANADEGHHCLHSSPWFGELLPEQSATRRGWILFGSDIHQLANELAVKISS